jgi:hypothetical protein
MAHAAIEPVALMKRTAMRAVLTITSTPEWTRRSQIRNRGDLGLASDLHSIYPSRGGLALRNSCYPQKFDGSPFVETTSPFIETTSPSIIYT